MREESGRSYSFILIKGEEATPLLDMEEMKALAKVSKSIGMFEGKLQGSCWRAGTDLIVTAWYLVHDHIRKLVYVRLVRTLGMLRVHKSSKFQYWRGGGGNVLTPSQQVFVLTP